MKPFRLLGIMGGIVCLCVFANSGCHEEASDALPGSGCEYVQIPGNATIIALQEPRPDSNNCANAVEVVFHFEPDDPTVSERYQWNWDGVEIGYWDDTDTITVGDGKNPPREWAMSHGLVEGSVHRSIRQELTKCCPCTPVVFTFPELDLTGWEAECSHRP